MLFPDLLSQELQRQRDSFARFDTQWRSDVDYYLQQLSAFRATHARQIRTQAELQSDSATPSNELEQYDSLTAPFGISWATHEAARRWALEILRNRVTCAADGSQLNPGREVSMPIALVQVAWFENHHNDAGYYHKGARPLIISPSELLNPAEGHVNPDTVISYRRFEMEVEALQEFMQRRQGWQARGEPVPLAIFDGSLTYMLSFSGTRTQIQDDYAQVVMRLLEFSQETQVPVVGYIDQSYARDLVRTVDAQRPEVEGTPNRYPYDAQLLAHILKNWGDRAIFCYYRSAGLAERLKGDGVGFTYLRTTAEGAPARLEIPVWVFRAGLLDEVLDTVRAECVCGLGYPYAIESADQAAVITSRDREIFLRTVQEFAQQGGFSFRVARKLASKMRRR